jgi:hypothetical protein
MKQCLPSTIILACESKSDCIESSSETAETSPFNMETVIASWIRLDGLTGVLDGGSQPSISF